MLLFVKPGEHGWRFDYRFACRRNMLWFRNYPNATLAIARRKADAARRPLAEGFDPSQRKAERQAQLEAYEDKQRVADGLPPRRSFEKVAWSGTPCARTAGRRDTATRSSSAFGSDVFSWDRQGAGG